MRYLRRFEDAGLERSRLLRGFLTELAPTFLVDRALLAMAPRGLPFGRWFQSIFDPAVARVRSSRSASGYAEVGRGRLHSLRRNLMQRSNLPMLLHYDDRASMASGIESRPVLLDPELVATALSMTNCELVKDGWLKSPLRDAMSGSVPDLVLTRRDKLGFAVPETAWMSGHFGDWLCARALDGIEIFANCLADHVDIPSISARMTVSACRGTPVWFLASLGVWARKFGVQ